MFITLRFKALASKRNDDRHLVTRSNLDADGYSEDLVEVKEKVQAVLRE